MLIAKVINAVAEASAVYYLYFEKGEKKEDGAVTTAKIIRKLVRLVMWITLPIRTVFRLLGIISVDEEEQALFVAFIEFSLLESLSYYEPKTFDQLWSQLKEDKRLQEAFKKKETSDKNIKRFIFVVLFIFGQVGVITMRLENKDQYIKRRLVFKKVTNVPTDSYSLNEKGGDIKAPDFVEKHIGKIYDSMENLPGYQKFYRGMHIVFLRKPIGTTKKGGLSLRTLSFVPGLRK